jgi:hypothetical protein
MDKLFHTAVARALSADAWTLIIASLGTFGILQGLWMFARPKAVRQRDLTNPIGNLTEEARPRAIIGTRIWGLAGAVLFGWMVFYFASNFHDPWRFGLVTTRATWFWLVITTVLAIGSMRKLLIPRAYLRTLESGRSPSLVRMHALGWIIVGGLALWVILPTWRSPIG